ncbi:MAG: hypothetical protein ACPG5B_00435 [Chitinophagales bacterium]
MKNHTTTYHKIFTHWLFLVAISLFLLNQIAEKCFQIFIPFWHAYGDDLLCMPVVLSIALYIQRRFTFRNPNYIFSKTQIIVAVAYYALAFEYLLPAYHSAYTADKFDIIAYSLGAFLFYFYLNLPDNRNIK